MYKQTLFLNSILYLMLIKDFLFFPIDHMSYNTFFNDHTITLM